MERCPHCGVNSPYLEEGVGLTTNSASHGEMRWKLFACNRCGGVVTVCTPRSNSTILQYFPQTQKVDESIPSRPANY